MKITEKIGNREIKYEFTFDEILSPCQHMNPKDRDEYKNDVFRLYKGIVKNNIR